MAALEVRVNGVDHSVEVSNRQTLADVIRDELGLTGTHLGCEQGACGACTVLMNGRPVRSCLVLGVQANGSEVTTVEGLANDPSHRPLFEAFERERAFQCGFCTPGILVTLSAATQGPTMSDDELVDLVTGHICRCTGYSTILDAARSVCCGGPR